MSTASAGLDVRVRLGLPFHLCVPVSTSCCLRSSGCSKLKSVSKWPMGLSHVCHSQVGNRSRKLRHASTVVADVVRALPTPVVVAPVMHVDPIHVAKDVRMKAVVKTVPRVVVTHALLTVAQRGRTTAVLSAAMMRVQHELPMAAVIHVQREQERVNAAHAMETIVAQHALLMVAVTRVQHVKAIRAQRAQVMHAQRALPMVAVTHVRHAMGKRHIVVRVPMHVLHALEMLVLRGLEMRVLHALRVHGLSHALRAMVRHLHAVQLVHVRVAHRAIGRDHALAKRC